MSTEGSDRAPIDELFRLLADPRRREILLTLARNTGGVDVGSLAGGPAPERSRVALHHVHLPKLAGAGYVEWAPGDSTVARGPRFDAAESVLELLRGKEGLPTGRP
jgi:hypothetical protein